MKKRKIRYKTRKFFGYSDEGWARGGGRWGKKRSYGHFSPGNPGGALGRKFRTPTICGSVTNEVSARAAARPTSLPHSAA